MKSNDLRRSKVALAAALITLAGFFLLLSSYAPLPNQSVIPVKIIIAGTSNIHDWELQSDKGKFSFEFNKASGGFVTGLSSLTFTLPVESLKSDHKGMDKNTYNALHSDKYSHITFSANAANIRMSSTPENYIISANGKLTISGITKDVQLNATGVLNTDKSITYYGSYKLKMTDYNVKPPSLMLGAIKTGDEITVRFQMTMKIS